MRGEFNPADAGTKYLSEVKMTRFMDTVLQEPVTGRAETSLKVAGGEKKRRSEVDDVIGEGASDEAVRCE